MVTERSRVVGLLVAASFSESPLIRYGGYALLASPVSCGLAFIWILSLRNGARDDGVGVEKA